MFKIQDTGCYNINVTFISSQKDGLLKYIKFEFQPVSSFSCILKKKCKVFGKNTVTFWHNFAYEVNVFLYMIIMTIANKTYSMLWTEKCKK